MGGSRPQGGSFRGPFAGPAQERYGAYLGKVAGYDAHQPCMRCNQDVPLPVGDTCVGVLGQGRSDPFLHSGFQSVVLLPLQVLHAPELPKPENATLLLSQVVINGLDKLNMSAGMGLGDGGSLWEEDDSAPFIVVFQYGRSVWAGFPVTRVRALLDLRAPPLPQCPLCIPRIANFSSEHVTRT